MSKLIQFLKLVPRNHLSRAVGASVRGPWPRSMHQAAIRAFIRSYRVEVEEAERPPEAYDTFAQFFTRALKPGARPVAPGPEVVVSPCDGRLGASGPVAAGQVLQAKGRPYDLGAFLGDEAWAARFEGGQFATIYLAPFDYHRVHAPVTGRVVEAVHVPGTLWPVNPASVARVEDLFVVNERLVTLLDTDRGPVGVVMVGATNVGRIRARYDDLLTNTGDDLGRRSYEPARPLAKGEELGVFELGSTVVLLLPPGSELVDAEPGRRMRMGEPLARFAA